MQPQQPDGRPRAVPGWNAPLPGPAHMPMAPPPRGWQPTPAAPRYRAHPPAPMPQGYPVPLPRAVYQPPAAYGYVRPPARRPGRGGLATAMIVVAVAFSLAVVSVVAVVGKRIIDSADRGPRQTTAGKPYGSSYRYPATTSRGTSSSVPVTSRPASTPPSPPPPPSRKPVHELGSHPLFRNQDQGFTNGPCSTTTWPFDIPHADTFYRELRGCMDPEWRRLLDEHNLPWSSPGLVVAGNYVDSPCGGVDFGRQTAAYYCPSNDTIYMSTVGVPPGRYGNHDGIYLAVFAHEYGHHAQSLSGMSAEQWRQRKAAGADSPLGLELSRRLELQAQCFSGMFLGSRRGGTISEAEFNLAWNDQDRGDGQQPKRDHGSNQHAESWWRHGARHNRTWQCNTWLSPSGEVS